MWNRIELKAAAKQRFHSNYWPSVVVAVILSITLGTFSLTQLLIIIIAVQILIIYYLILLFLTHHIQICQHT